jgi:predicted nucleic acid-binding protein
MSSHLLLDACVVVNLYATRQMPAILMASGTSHAIVNTVYREAQYVYRGGDGEDAREREQIDLLPLVASNLLPVIDATDEDELLIYIDLSRELDDGEAMTAAVAIHRGYTVATDDRKAVHVLQRHQVPLCTSLDLIKAWAERQSVSSEMVRMALRDLRQRGNYLPANRHPLKAWWDEMLGEGDVRGDSP